MVIPKAPCKDCVTRNAECHATCEGYKKYKEEYKTYKEAKDKQRKLERIMNDQVYESIVKTRFRLGVRGK